METLEDLSTEKDIGRFNGIVYGRTKGRFSGRNSLQEPYSVPFEITFPIEISRGTARILVEPPHFVERFVARDNILGPEFIFARGIGHASVGYSFVGQRILDPSPGFELIIRGKTMPETPPTNPADTTYTDREIIASFAGALRRRFVSRKVYSIGFSDSGSALRQVLQADYGENLFDLSFPSITTPIAPIDNRGRVIVFNTEFDFRPVDATSPNYRRYTAAGGPHITDTKNNRQQFPDPPPHGSTFPPVAGTTPINWLPFFKALFVAGDKWITEGHEPPPSAVLELTPSGNIKRNEKCNALGGIRHPALQLDEARFIGSVVRGQGWQLFGAYGSVRFVTEADFPAYLESFRRAVESLVESRLLLQKDATDLINKANLKPPNTFTINYADGLFDLG
jgi:hypothetical protein